MLKKIQTVVQNLVWPTGNDSLIVNRSHTWISYLHPEFVQRVFKEGLQLTGFDVAVVYDRNKMMVFLSLTLE